MHLIEVLQKSETGGAERKVFSANNICFCTIWRKHENDGYGLTRKVLSKEGNLEGLDTWNFRYLTDLFVMAKQQGFFHEIEPNASDWYIADWEMMVEAEYPFEWIMVKNYTSGDAAYDYSATSDEE